MYLATKIATGLKHFIKQLSSVDKLQTIVQLAHDTGAAWSEWLYTLARSLKTTCLIRGPPWAEHELRNAHKANKAAWAHYRQLRNETNKICKAKYECFINELGNCTAKKPKEFWSFVKTKTG